jgi:hypothetical protein
MQIKEYGHLLGMRQGRLIAIDIERFYESDVSKQSGKRLRTMITARCDCGGTITCRASVYHNRVSCGCRGERNKYVTNVDRKKRKEEAVSPKYEPCTVNGVALADYLEGYREAERKERDKDTRKLFCHSVETNIAVLRSH